MMPFRAPVNSSLADSKSPEAAFILVDVELDVSMPDFNGCPHDVLWNVESDFVLTHRKRFLNPRMLTGLRLRETLRFDRRHATCSGRGDGLPVSAVLDIAGVKDALNV